WTLADGTIGIIHDATVDRTTTNTGNTAEHTAGSLAQLTVDPASVLGGNWANMQGAVPNLTHVLDEFGGRVGLALEVMDAKAAAIVVPMIVSRGLEKTACIFSRNLPDLAPGIAAGIQGWFIDDTGATP